MTIPIIILIAATIALIVYKNNNRKVKTTANKPVFFSKEKEVELNYDSRIIYFLKNKIGYFSSAKNKEEANFISRLVATNGQLKRWAEFRNKVLSEIPDYDAEKLKKEFYTFYGMAPCYQSWTEAQQDKELFPYLKYDAVTGGETCPTCKKLNNITRPIDDPFWDVYFPPNCDSCRCIVLQLGKYDKVVLTDLSKKQLLRPADKYAINVGKHELKLSYDSKRAIENYAPQQIERTAFQSLETIHMIASSKSIDTVAGRYTFLTSIYSGLIKSKDCPGYITDIQYSLDKYKQKYYAKIPTDTEIHLVVKPNNIDLQEFYCNSLVSCCKVNGENTAKEIRILKREEAKTRRTEKFKALLQTTDAEITKHCSLTTSYSDALNIIDKLESELTTTKRMTLSLQLKHSRRYSPTRLHPLQPKHYF
jgi:hypothetical protein